MRIERLTAADKRLVAIVVLIAAAAILYTRHTFLAAFPEASIDLRYSRSEITRMAEEFLREQGISTEGFRNLTVFDPDSSARLYLERELELVEANRLMQEEVSVWRWRARWFRPPEQEEMLVLLSPTGELAGFQHVIPEAEPGARMEQAAARELAEAFLAQRSSAPHRLIEEQLQERPARHDFLFTWEQEGFRAKDATYRRTVVVQGGRVGRYSEFLHIPEQWSRDFARLRASNELYTQIAQALYVLLALAALVMLIQFFRRSLIRWRPLVIISSAVAILMVVSQWNSLPFFIDGMPTSSPYHQSVLFGLLLGLGAGVGVFFYVILAAAAGEPLYRSSQPGNLSLLAVPTRKGIRTKEFFIATVVGYGFTALHIAFVAAFYLVGRRFGVWSPQDINYSDFLSTGLPWIYPLTISLLASTSEEFWFRLLAIPLLKRYLRSTWLAILIPAFVWGFLHADYPQQPGYIRGIEVGIIGVAAGWLMLRFGILATLIWHYAVDAIFIGMFLIRADSLYFQISGWVVGGAVLFPMLVSLAFYRRHGGFLADPDLSNAGIEQKLEAPRLAVIEAPPAAEPLAPRWSAKWLYIGAAVACLTGFAFHAPRYGDFIEVHLSRPQAEQAAERAFQARVAAPDPWRRVTQFYPNLRTTDFEYIRRHAGAQAANDAVRERADTGFWRTRYFQPLLREEWRVFVSRRGEVYRVDHLLDETAPGADLPADEARRIAEEYLRREQELPVDRYRLVDATSDRKKRRTDHTFVWEDPTFEVAEARARISLLIQGDEPSFVNRFLKLPEEWLRQFHRPRFTDIITPGTLGALGMLLLLVFVRRLGQRDAQQVSLHHYHWRVYLWLGGAAAAAELLAALNRWPVMLAGYDTAKPLEGYLAQTLLGQTTGVLLTGFGIFFAVLAADVFLQMAVGDRSLPAASVLRAAAIFAGLWGLMRAAGALEAHVPGPRFSLPLWSLPGVDTAAPAVEVLSWAFVSTVALLCVVTIVVGAAVRFVAPERRPVLVVLAALVYAAGRAHSLPQTAFAFFAALAAGALLIAVLRICAADLVSFAVALFWLLAAGPVVTLIEQPAPFFRWNGAAGLALAALAGAVVSLRFRRPRLT